MVDSPAPYPEHEKMMERRADLDAVGDFYDWLTSNGYRICTLDPDGRALLAPSIRDLLAMWVDVDQTKLEDEKRAMLAVLRDASRPRSAPGDKLLDDITERAGLATE